MKISKSETEMQILRQQVSNLEEKIDDNDAYERRDTLMLFLTSFSLSQTWKTTHSLSVNFP